ncbi:hypothetical protein POTOM_010118 [Populus tomentosa]|uniref:Uncharacterized protein n=1 Tax=Populus tomentosa TaxID=118781 RepID=A0A8X8ACG0_POPTO|nr:hypothetical protein POTOM_010118 [Populus tomentosa]
MEKIRVAVRVRPAVTVSEDTTINGTCWKKIASLFTNLMALLSPASLMPLMLSDAASLKRQKLEIEEQRKKLQGSRAEVLEQEILKLRNDMLKYELEREKLEVELEEERKSHKERDQCIKEEQMKIGNLNTRATSADRWCKSSSQLRKHLKDAEKYSYANQRPVLVVGTECWETEPRGIQWQQHCLRRRCFWNPYLDSIQMTPPREVQSFPSSDETQSLVPDGDSSIGKFLSTTCEIGLSLFSNLEKRFSMEMDDHKSFNVNDSLVQENWKVLSERLKGIITSLALAEKLAVQNKEGKNPICGSAYKILGSNITALFIAIHTEEIRIRLQSKIRLHYLFNVAEPKSLNVDDD